MSEAVTMLMSSEVASEAEMAAAWLTSAAVIWIGLTLSELHAAIANTIGAQTRSERFIGFPSCESGRIAGAEHRDGIRASLLPRFARSTSLAYSSLRDIGHR